MWRPFVLAGARAPLWRLSGSERMVDYALLAKTNAALTEGETDPVALMATVACEVHFSDARFDWTDFYRVVAPQMMKIGPY